MNAVLTDIRSVGGVVGCFLYDTKGGIAASDAPTVFKPAKLAEVGRALAKTLKAANLANPEAVDLSLYYDEILIVAREIAKGSILVVLCDPGMNVNLLSMSINLALDELVELAGSASAQTVVSPPAAANARVEIPKPTAPSPAAAPKEKAKATIDAEGYRELELALAKVVGPMASIILADCREKWEERGTHVDELAAMLKAEIGDPAKAVKFAALAAPLFRRMGGGNG